MAKLLHFLFAQNVERKREASSEAEVSEMPEAKRLKVEEVEMDGELEVSEEYVLEGT